MDLEVHESTIAAHSPPLILANAALTAVRSMSIPPFCFAVLRFPLLGIGQCDGVSEISALCMSQYGQNETLAKVVDSGR